MAEIVQFDVEKRDLLDWLDQLRRLIEDKEREDGGAVAAFAVVSVHEGGSVTTGFRSISHSFALLGGMEALKQQIGLACAASVQETVWQLAGVEPPETG